MPDEAGSRSFMDRQVTRVAHQLTIYEVPVQKTCDGVLEYLESNGFMTSSGFYWIDPDEHTGILQPFFAYCDFYYPDAASGSCDLEEHLFIHQYCRLICTETQ